MIRLFLPLFCTAAAVASQSWSEQEPAAAAPKTCCSTESTPVATLASQEAEQPQLLDEIKALVGDWYEVDDQGKASANLVSTYRITAGGNAVIETLFPGSEHEMISMYHMDGGDLMLTHYCVLGNAPYFVGKRTKDGFLWSFRGGHNLASENDAHMHEGHTILKGKNHMQGKWLQTVDGEVTYEAAFDLVRVAE